MLLGFLGIAIGILLGGVVFQGYIPDAYSVYVAVALLAAADTLVGGIGAKLDGRFNVQTFIGGFLINAMLAALLTYVGRLLALDLTIAVIVVFGTRLFQNFAKIRRLLLNTNID